MVRGDNREQAPPGERGQPGDARAYQNVVLSFSVFTSNVILICSQANLFSRICDA